MAYFYGSTGSDTFYANADYNSSGVHTAGMLGSYTGSQGTVNYANAATGFATNVGNTLPNTSDTAYFYGAAGNNTYYAYAYAQNGNSVTLRRAVSVVSAAGTPIRPPASPSTSAITPARAATPVGPTPPKIPATGTAYFYNSPGNNVYYAYGDYADYMSSNPSGPSAGMYGSYAGFGGFCQPGQRLRDQHRRGDQRRQRYRPTSGQLAGPEHVLMPTPTSKAARLPGPRPACTAAVPR